MLLGALLLLSLRVWAAEGCEAHDFQPVCAPASCTESGYQGLRCSRCGQTKDMESLPQLEHVWGEWTIRTEADSENEGLRSHTCKVCGETAEESIPPWGNPFTDLEEDGFYYESVLWACNNGIADGLDETHFGPLELCTRAQVVTFLWRAAGEPEPFGGEMPFEDVAPGAYYAEAVAWAVESGVTKGVDSRHFTPDRVCTRAQVVTFLHRFEGEPAATGEEPFEDVRPGDYFCGSVCWAYETGITLGTGAAAFSPHSDCTRGQIVTFLHRARKL